MQYCAKSRSSDSINIREVLLAALDRTQRFGTNQTSSMRAVGPQKPVETISRSTVRLRRLSIVISERSAKSLLDIGCDRRTGRIPAMA